MRLALSPRGVLLTARLLLLVRLGVYTGRSPHSSPAIASASGRLHRAFSSQLKSKVAHILAKPPALPINLSIDGEPIAVN